jgi:hypothetical protein
LVQSKFIAARPLIESPAGSATKCPAAGCRAKKRDEWSLEGMKRRKAGVSGELCQSATKRVVAVHAANCALRRNPLAARIAGAYSATHRQRTPPTDEPKPKESTMYATSKTVRLVSAAMAVFVGATLVVAKAHFSDEYTRLTARSDVLVLPVAEVIGERPATNLAATASQNHAN